MNKLSNSNIRLTAPPEDGLKKALGRVTGSSEGMSREGIPAEFKKRNLTTQSQKKI